MASQKFARAQSSGTIVDPCKAQKGVTRLLTEYMTHFSKPKVHALYAMPALIHWHRPLFVDCSPQLVISICHTQTVEMGGLVPENLYFDTKLLKH